MINDKEGKKFISGFVAVLGRPNVGKSTLVNSLIGSKISIVSPIPQTTRHQIKGILNLEHAQIVFVDTPGVHSFKDKLASHLNVIAKRSLKGCDVIAYVVDASRKPGEEEDKIIDIILSQKIKTIMILNKVDLGVNFLNNYIDLWNQKVKKDDINDPLIFYIPVSAVKGNNLEELKKVLLDNLPDSCAYYDKNVSTDFPLKFRIADIIREKLFLVLEKELPHSLAVEVESIKAKGKSKNKVISIKVNIYVERKSQKRIVVGKGGQILKTVGIRARRDIEKIYNKKVFLDIWVTILPQWKSKPRILKELGYWWV